MACSYHLLFLGRLVHFGLEEINEFGLLRYSPLHLYLLVGVYSLQERKHMLKNTSEHNGKKNSPREHMNWITLSSWSP